jgi:hypothetical protein
MPSCKIDQPSIVLVGTFNPGIFHPEWFAARNLIRPAESETASVQVVHPRVASCSFGLAEVAVTLDRFQVVATDGTSLEPLKDLVTGVFSFLNETPVIAMGLNRYMHFQMQDHDAWNSVGHALAPKEHWNKLMQNPGMEALTMLGHRGQDDGPEFRVTVQPSRQIQPGVYVSTNEHYNATKNIGAIEELVDILKNTWSESMAAAKKTAEALLETAR